MNILKKIIFIGSVFSIGFFTNITEVSASRSTAKEMGFKPGDYYEYITDSTELITSDYNPFAKSLDGSKWHYGDMGLWVGIYSYKPKNDSSKYYCIMVEAINTSNTEKLKNGYYKMVNREMEIDVNISNKNKDSVVKLSSYTPEKLGVPVIKESASTSYGIGVGIPLSISFSFGVSYSVDVFKEIVSLTPESIYEKDGSGSKTRTGVKMKYSFDKTGKSKYNNKPPLRGDCIQRCAFVYQMTDYARWKEEELEFSINYTGKIRKFACLAWGNDGCETETGTISAYCRPYYAEIDEFSSYD